MLNLTDTIQYVNNYSIPNHSQSITYDTVAVHQSEKFTVSIQ